jgi:hypothetical protein
MNPRISKALKIVGLWCNRTNDAWSMGEADWAKGPNGDFLTGLVSQLIQDHEDDPERWEEAAAVVKAEALARGIDLKRHHWRPVR